MGGSGPVARDCSTTMGLPLGPRAAMAALLTLLAVCHGQMIKQCNQPASDNSSIYDFTMLDITKTKNISLSDYRGKVVLVVNVATY